MRTSCPSSEPHLAAFYAVCHEDRVVHLEVVQGYHTLSAILQHIWDKTKLVCLTLLLDCIISLAEQQIHVICEITYICVSSVLASQSPQFCLHSYLILNCDES